VSTRKNKTKLGAKKNKPTAAAARQASASVAVVVAPLAPRKIESREKRRRVEQGITNQIRSSVRAPPTLGFLKGKGIPLSL
jgi:hypothetical protein